MSASAMKQLQKLTEAVALTKRDLALAEEGHSRTLRELKEAEAARDAYHASVAAGERPEDESEESRLVGAIAKINGRLHTVDGTPRDIAVEARSRHLRKARDLQVERRDGWIRQNRAALIAEGHELARVERDKYRSVVSAIRDSIASWQAVEAFWRSIGTQLELKHGDIPSSPLLEALQAADMQVKSRGNAPHLTTPAPWWTLPDDELPDSLLGGAPDRRNPARARARVLAAQEALRAEAGQ